MKILIHEISYKNIREMKEITLNLCKLDAPKHVSLIQMPTGVGKTTTMELIRYCLDKGAENLSKEKVMSFKPPMYDDDSGEFKIKFTIDGKIKVVNLEFDYINGTAKYLTTSTETGGKVEGLELGRDIEPWLKNKDFVRLFIFDGELAGQLLSSDSTSAEEAINALYHLNNIKYLYMNDGKIGKILNQRIGFGAQTNQALRGLETKITKASERKTDLENDINKFTSERDGYVRQITSDQEKIEAFRKEDEALIVEYEGLRITNVTIEVSIKETSERLLGVMRVPSNISLDLHEKLVNLSSYMNRLKLPKTQSMEFFEELSHADLCVCGRPIGEEERKRIIENSQNYLTSDNIGEINAIKTSIRTLPEREDISQLIKDIKDLIVKKNLNEKRLSKLDRETKNKVKIKELDDNIKKLERLRDELNDILITLTETRKEEQDLLSLTWEDNLDLCKKYIENLEIQLATATNAVEFRTKSIVLRNILTEIHEQSLKRLKNNILFKTNEKIEKILKTKNIRISEIGSCLALSDRDGVSEGQKLSIAYAFLSTLFSESPHKLPFVVDTPAAPLDLEVRREVAEILPNLFDQTVVFITSGEKAGFAERLYTRNDCLFLTVTRTPEGAVVKDGIEIFKNFQSEES